MTSRDTHDDPNEAPRAEAPEAPNDRATTGAGETAADEAGGIAEGVIPTEVTADYRNEAARAALDALMATPDYDRLSAFFTAISNDYLVVDVSGSKHKKKGTRVRTVRSTKGQLILPIFTSMAELRAAVPVAQRETVKGAVMPAMDALALITTDNFVGAQFDAGSAAFVVLRKYLQRIIAGEDISADALQS